MKKDERKSALAARRALTLQQRRDYSLLICRKLLALPELSGAKCVFSYLAAWDEVDLSLLNSVLEERGTVLAYPVCFEEGRMEACVPDSPQAVVPGAFGIKSPDPARSRVIDPKEIDVIMVPCVAFDRGRNRLGHGGGYYDRYLPRCPQARSVCVAFEAQRLEKLSVDEHDRKMDMVITEHAGL